MNSQLPPLPPDHEWHGEVVMHFAGPPRVDERFDDTADEYVIAVNKDAPGGLILWGKLRGEWHANWGERGAIAVLLAEVERLTRERDEARKSENTQCDLRYMETEHRERLEQFVRSLLNPEELGYAVPAHVRDAARVALGMQAVESEAPE